MSAVLETRNLLKYFGSLLATDHVSLQAKRGETVAIIGPNGAGKTTLIGQISGEITPDQGQVFLGGEDVSAWSVHRRALHGLGRSYQISQVFNDLSVLENVRLAVQARAGHSMRFFRPAEEQHQLISKAKEVIAQTGLSEQTERIVHTLAHGERRQLELAMVLATQPFVLLLDEPMAGMSRAESMAITELLQKIKTNYATLLIEHDMDAVFALADKIVVLAYGKIIAEGTADEIRLNPLVQEAYLGTGAKENRHA